MLVASALSSLQMLRSHLLTALSGGLCAATTHTSQRPRSAGGGRGRGGGGTASMSGTKLAWHPHERRWAMQNEGHQLVVRLHVPKHTALSDFRGEGGSQGGSRSGAGGGGGRGSGTARGSVMSPPPRSAPLHRAPQARVQSAPALRPAMHSLAAVEERSGSTPTKRHPASPPPPRWPQSSSSPFLSDMASLGDVKQHALLSSPGASPAASLVSEKKMKEW